MRRRIRWKATVGLFALGIALYSFPACAESMLYIAQDRVVHVYEENTWTVVKTIRLPEVHGVRGIDISKGGDSMLYISYEDALTRPGWLVKYDLVNDRVVWNRMFPHGIDQFSLSRNGTKLYMPAQALPNGE